MNHIINASSMSECAANHNLFHLGVKVAVSDASTIFCLFFTIEATALLATPNSLAIADLNLFATFNSLYYLLLLGQGYGLVIAGANFTRRHLHCTLRMYHVISLCKNGHMSVLYRSHKWFTLTVFIQGGVYNNMTAWQGILYPFIVTGISF